MATHTPAVTGETPSQRSMAATTLQVTHSVISSSHPPFTDKVRDRDTGESGKNCETETLYKEQQEPVAFQMVLWCLLFFEIMYIDSSGPKNTYFIKDMPWLGICTKF